jgi:dTDP-4-dehydrorhamnose reductase
MNTLVLGASGQLGHCIAKVATERSLSGIIFPEESAANILNPEQLDRLLAEHMPAYVVNCAAYTAVDKAEDEVELARKVNAEGAANIARTCAVHGAVLIHVSTDFVFEGKQTGVLSETDHAEPINVYGLTKLEGEQQLVAILPAHFILRTSWLYSEYGNNFVKTMLRLGKERESLGVIVDQVGSPTYAIDLAGAILDIVASGSHAYGIYHYSNEGVTSWYDFAKAIFDLSGTTVQVNPLKTSEYPTKAVRPLYSVMDKSKVKNAFGISIPYWRDSLATCLNRL